MSLKVNCVFVLVCVVSFVNCLPKPRDSTVLHSENTIKTELEPVHKNVEESLTAKSIEESSTAKTVEESSTAKVENPGKCFILLLGIYYLFLL